MEGTLGEIVLFAGGFDPKNWRRCDGGMLEVGDNPALFSIISNRHGGDGIDNFNLPNMESPHPELRYIICVQGNYPPRN